MLNEVYKFFSCYLQWETQCYFYLSRTYKDLHESKNNVLDQKKKKTRKYLTGEFFLS